MNQNSLFAKMEKGLRLLAGLALALMLFQGLGVLIYILTVWPQMSGVPSTGTTIIVTVAVAAALVRSYLWIRIYWNGSKVLSTLRINEESTELSDRLVPILRTLTRLLVTSCILDVLLLPAIFLMDVFFPFTVSSWQLGLVDLGLLLFPQAFGLAALILAYLTHQYGQLMKERGQMKKDLELTI
ncbi:hypothetical protein ACFL2F_04825 [Myxococcota bacterium]